MLSRAVSAVKNRPIHEIVESDCVGEPFRWPRNVLGAAAKRVAPRTESKNTGMNKTRILGSLRDFSSSTM